jgi:ribulose-5-phosphate 4-epimerase/fuculose-1-phosphate aldolase
VFGTLSYHDYEGIALDLDERTRMAANLGPRSKAMILRNHGLLALGETVHEAFQIMYYLDCSCQIQIDALAGGHTDVQLISEATSKKGYEQFERPGGSESTREWPALLRMLDRKGVNYRQ